MRKRIVLASIVATLALGFGISLTFADDKDKPKDKPAKVAMPECPVMGEPVNFLVHTDTDRGPVYFCCGMCIGKYKKDTAKYAKAVEAQRAAVAKLPKVQVVCGVCEAPPAKDVTADYKGEKIGFCCKECSAKFTKDPDKYAKNVAACYTYQTTCPVGGEKIDPSSSILLKDGGRIYFCCDKCKPAFEKDLAKYAPKLEAQGYYVKEKDLKKS